MDLRPYNLTAEQVERAKTFISNRLLWYQPFIITDTLETGEGMNFRNHYQGETGSVYWPEAPAAIRDLIVHDLDRFRTGNEGLRQIYERLIDALVRELGKISELTFAEVGCNSGYFVHALALRGARRTIGFDFAVNNDLFAWFNEILGTRSEFRWAEWDSLHHTLRYSELEQVDVTMSLAVTPHIFDPVEHLCYLCDRARVAVLFWIPSNDKEDISVTFSHVDHHRDPDLDFPLNINSGVELSHGLVRKILIESGFEDLRPIGNLSPSSEWDRFIKQHAGYVALRTRNIKTAISGARSLRKLPVLLPRRQFSVRERIGKLARRWFWTA